MRFLKQKGHIMFKTFMEVSVVLNKLVLSSPIIQLVLFSLDILCGIGCMSSKKLSWLLLSGGQYYCHYYFNYCLLRYILNFNKDV